MITLDIYVDSYQICTWMMSFISALSVDILAFFITETLGPTQVTITNFDLLDISSPVWEHFKFFSFLYYIFFILGANSNHS